MLHVTELKTVTMANFTLCIFCHSEKGRREPAAPRYHGPALGAPLASSTSASATRSLTGVGGWGWSSCPSGGHILSLLATQGRRGAVGCLMALPGAVKKGPEDHSPGRGAALAIHFPPAHCPSVEPAPAAPGEGKILVRQCLQPGLPPVSAGSSALCREGTQTF